MIRIDLQQRVARYRWLGIGLGLALAFAAFGGALYTLDRRVPLHSFWDRWSAALPVPPAIPVAVEPTPDIVAVPLVTMAADLPVNSQVAGGFLLMVAQMSTAVDIRSLTIEANGAFVLEGQLDATVELAQLLESLQPHVSQLRGTKWSAAESDQVHCRLTGRLVSPAGGAQSALAPAEALQLLAVVEGEAAESGLQSVVITSPQSAPTVDGLHVYQADLTAAGSAAAVARLVQSLAAHDARIRMARLAVVRSQVAGFHSPITLSLDIIVRESP